MQTIYSRIKLLALLTFGLCYGQNASALIVVTNTNDGGPGSLRNAIGSAVPGELILFDPGIAGQTINLTSGQIIIPVQMTIDGETNDITISGSNNSRIFDASGAVSFQLYNLTLTNGQATLAAAIYSTGGVDLTVENVIFKNNYATGGDGGAIRALAGTHYFRNCQFTGNQCTALGGAYYQLFGTIFMENCVFTGNLANGGGAIQLRGSSTFIGCTFSGNRATNATGGGVFSIYDGSDIEIVNTIFWNNQSGANIGTLEAFYTMQSGSPTLLGLQNSFIQGSGGSGSWNSSFGTNAGGNLDGNPNFIFPISPISAPTSAGNYRPEPPSTAIDAGDNVFVTLPSDLDGHNRIIYGTVDMGAYEFCTTTSSITQTVCDSYNSPAGNIYTATGVYYDTLSNYLGCDSVITINLTVDQTAIVNAGSDQTVCANNASVALAGTVTYATGGTWTSTGSGTFSPSSTALNATYTPSASDILGGTVNLTLTSTGNGACTPQLDNMIVTISSAPTADAGADISVCADSPTAALLGTVTIATGGIWSTSGTGTFAPSNNVLNPVYTPSPADILAGTVTIVLTTTGNGTCSPEADTVILTINPLPSVIAGGDQTVCEGTSVTLTGSGTASSYTWDNGVSDGTGFTPAVGALTYTVVGTDLNGCQSSDQVLVTVNPLPIVSFSALPTLCENDAPYTLIEGTPPGGVYSGPGVSGGNFDPSVNMSGIYPLTYTYTDGNSCINLANQNISVLASPAVVATGTATICEGSSTAISATGAVTYFWDNGLGAGTTHVVSPTASNTYTVTGTGSNGCANTDNVTISVNPLPVVNFAALSPLCFDGPPYTFVEGTPPGGSYSGPGVTGGIITQSSAGLGVHTIYYSYTDGNGCTNIDSSDIEIYNSPAVMANATSTNLCLGDALTLTGSGASSYSWNNGVVDGVTFNPPAGSYTYVVTGADINGCQGVDSVMVTVNPLPTVNGGADITTCEGTQITLTGGGASSYSWSNGAQNGVAFSPSVGTTIYVVTGTDANSCQQVDTVLVTVNPNPVLVVSPDQLFCLGDTVVLNASGSDSYNWNSGASLLSSYTILPTTSVAITVTGTSTFGCVSSETINLALDDPNNVDAGADQEICNGFTANLSASGGVDYYWNGPGYVDENTQQISFSVDTTAYYSVSITTANGCVYTDSVLISVSNDPSCTIETVSSITPNDDGINDFWKIQGIEGFPDNHVVVYNRWGDIVFDETGYDNDFIKWDGMYNGNVLAAGTYFYLIEINNGPTESGWIQLMK